MKIKVPPRQIEDPPRDFRGRESDLYELHAEVKRGNTCIGVFGMGGVGKTTLAQKLAKDLTLQYPTQIYLPLMGTQEHPLSPAEAMVRVIHAFDQNYRIPRDASAIHANIDTASLQRQLDEKQGNLRLIEEREAEYVLRIDIPFQLVKEERKLRDEIDELKKLLSSELGNSLNKAKGPSETVSLSKIESEIQGHYLSILRTQKVLLLADDAQGYAQIKPLIPPSNCLLLVTSRDRFVIPGLYQKPVDVFSPKSACDFLLSIAERIGNQADTIARLCGYLPLALRAAGSLLAVRGGNPETYAESLRNERRRLENIGSIGVNISVEASINLSYEHLLEPTREVFEKLSVFHERFDRAAESFVCNDVNDSEHLYILAEYSLVEHDERLDRYKLHDLIRIFADTHLRKRVGDPNVNIYYRRYATYYVGILKRTDNLYTKNNKRSVCSGESFDIELPNIISGQRWVARCFQDNPVDKEAARLCINYAESGGDYISQRLFSQDYLAWQKAALAAAKLLKDTAAEAVHLGASGNIQATLGETISARSDYLQQLQLARMNGDVRTESDALGNLGNIHMDLGQVDEALNYYRQQIVILHKANDQRGKHVALTNLGIAYRKKNLGQALRILNKELAYAQKAEDLQGEAVILVNLGLIHFDTGETDKAIKDYRKARDISHQIDDRRNEATALWNMSVAYATGRDDYEHAVLYAGLAYELFEKIEERNLQMIEEALEDWRSKFA